MVQTEHFNCCFQPGCNTPRDFEVRLQHYSFISFDASEIPSVARTMDGEVLPLLGLDKSPSITVPRFDGFS